MVDRWLGPYERGCDGFMFSLEGLGLGGYRWIGGDEWVGRG